MILASGRWRLQLQYDQPQSRPSALLTHHFPPAYPSAVFCLLLVIGLYAVRWRQPAAPNLPRRGRCCYLQYSCQRIYPGDAVVPAAGRLTCRRRRFLLCYVYCDRNWNVGFSFYLCFHFLLSPPAHISSIVGCGLYYAAWVFQIPRLLNYCLRQEVIVLEDGPQSHKLIMVPNAEVAIWDCDHDAVGRCVNHEGGVVSSLSKISSSTENMARRMFVKRSLVNEYLMYTDMPCPTFDTYSKSS